MATVTFSQPQLSWQHEGHKGTQDHGTHNLIPSALEYVPSWQGAQTPELTAPAGIKYRTKGRWLSSHGLMRDHGLHITVYYVRSRCNVPEMLE